MNLNLKLNNVIQTLKILHKYLNNSKLNWWIIGKTNLMLQGIKIQPSKIGILIEWEDLKKFLTLFSKFEHSEIISLENGEALEFILWVEKVKCLICAEYAHGIYRRLTSDTAFVKIENIEIPCFSLKSEQEAYQKLGMVEISNLISQYRSSIRKNV